jgi:hypothetical protein
MSLAVNSVGQVYVNMRRVSDSWFLPYYLTRFEISTPFKSCVLTPKVMRFWTRWKLHSSVCRRAEQNARLVTVLVCKQSYQEYHFLVLPDRGLT